MSSVGVTSCHGATVKANDISNQWTATFRCRARQTSRAADAAIGSNVAAAVLGFDVGPR
jgi:hypothetical protein